MFAVLKSRAVRNVLLQAGFVGAILIMLVTFMVTAKINLDAQGMTSGFGFLERATGWKINFSLLEYSTSSPYWKAILIGVLNSLFLGAITLPLATVIGVTIGVMRTSGNGMAELIGTVYVEIIRNIPLLLQLFFWYTVLVGLPGPREVEPIFGSFVMSGRGIFFPGLNVSVQSVALASLAVALVGAVAVQLSTTRWLRADPGRVRNERRLLWVAAVLMCIAILWVGRLPETSLVSLPERQGLNYQGGIRVAPELMSCILAISIYGAAYIAEIVRAGFNAVPRGQQEAGRALGLTAWQIFSRIRLPLAIRIVLPTMTNQYVWLFKATTMGIAVSFADFFMVISTSVVQSGQTLELVGILMGGFLIINYSIAWVLNRVNDAIKLRGTQLRI